MKRKPIGVDDFKKIIDNDMYFVDRTLFIKEIIDSGSEVTLIARPRRFGKTLNMSMLKYYFEKTEEDNSYLFKDYAIWQQGEQYREEFGKYPVINLTLKSLKYYSWKENYNALKSIIASEYSRYEYILESDKLNSKDKEKYMDIINGQGNNADYSMSLEFLSKNLCQYYNKKAIILIDEYDMLINNAYIHGFWKDAICFMETFLTYGFKNNIYLHKGVLTGILRVLEANVDSGFNNVKSCTIFDDSYVKYFGFVENEVKEMADYFGIEYKSANIAEWYNGYVFGRMKNMTMYNPESIIMYMNKLLLEPYWTNTSPNEMIKKLITQGSQEILLDIYDIIEGIEIENIQLNTNITYNDIISSRESVISFMLMSGYLKPVKTKIGKYGEIYCDLKVSNKEVYFFFRNLLENWFSETVIGGSVDKMLKALLTGDIDTFHQIFAKTVIHVLSYNDVGEDKSESFYHAFVLGMLVNIDKEYEIKSNRESGYGRYDVMIIPKDTNKKAIIIEFKRASELRKESIEKALELAKKQLNEKKYETELIGRGIKDIMKLAIAFKGKEVIMEKWNLER